MIAAAFVAVAAAGALGRWQLRRLSRPDWPVGTLVANVVAAFAAGLLHARGADTRTLVGVALLGSLSTFSTVVREVAGATTLRRAGGYLLVTLVVGIAAAYAGLQLG